MNMQIHHQIAGINSKVKTIRSLLEQVETQQASLQQLLLNRHDKDGIITPTEIETIRPSETIALNSALTSASNDMTAALMQLSKAKFRLALVEKDGVVELQCFWREVAPERLPQVTFILGKITDDDLDSALLAVVRDAYQILRTQAKS